MISKDPFIDRRKDPRIDFSIPIKIEQDEGDLVTETRNISRSGIYCRVNRYIAPMTKLKISLLLPVKKKEKSTIKKISCQGIVVRSEPIEGEAAFNTAIFFNEISQKDAKIIAEYVNTFLKK